MGRYESSYIHPCGRAVTSMTGGMGGLAGYKTTELQFFRPFDDGISTSIVSVLRTTNEISSTTFIYYLSTMKSIREMTIFYQLFFPCRLTGYPLWAIAPRCTGSFRTAAEAVGPVGSSTRRHCCAIRDTGRNDHPKRSIRPRCPITTSITSNVITISNLITVTPSSRQVGNT